MLRKPNNSKSILKSKVSGLITGQGCFNDIDLYVIKLRLLCILNKSRRLKIVEDLIVGYLGIKNLELSK